MGYIVSLGLIGTGFIIHYFYPSLGTLPWGPLKLIAWLFGGIILIANIAIPTGVVYMLPSLTLDNELGALVVMRDKAQACIPYQEIEQFSIYDKVTKSKNDTDSHYYYLFVQCKDSSQWYLTEAATLERAHELLARIQSHCDLSIPFRGADRMANKPALQQGFNAGKFMVTWSNKIKGRILPPFLAMLALILFNGAFAFVRESDGTAAMGFYITALLSIFPAFLIGKVIARIIRDIRFYYALIATDTTLEYTRFSKKTGKQKNSMQYTWSQIKAIAYSFTESHRYNNTLNILLEDDEKLSLHFDQVSPVERLQLANTLRSIRQKTKSD